MRRLCSLGALLIQWPCVAALAGAAWFGLLSEERVCYGRWGCFSLREPFDNTGHLPEPPSELGLQLFLHTRARPRGQRLGLNWSPARLARRLDAGKDTRLILHGYLDSRHHPWVADMTDRLLNKADDNVVVVDWAQGAASINYLQVAANTRLVARMVAQLISKVLHNGATPSQFHLIGVSLGAHIAGYVGSEIPHIGRITGLDPAGLAFEDTSTEVRLDPSDADFVDVIHTDALPFSRIGLGYIKPCGTVDFYPNHGHEQPGCHRSLMDRLFGVFNGDDLINLVSCNHLRALYLFLDSISSDCAMRAAPCPFPRVLQPAGCHPAPPCAHCPALGYAVNTSASGVYWLGTRARAPFCLSA